VYRQQMRKQGIVIAFIDFYQNFTFPSPVTNCPK
jgi:hypothetical protein